MQAEQNPELIDEGAEYSALKLQIHSIVFLVSTLSILNNIKEILISDPSPNVNTRSVKIRGEKYPFLLSQYTSTQRRKKRYAITSKDLLELSKLLLSSVVSSLFPVP